MTMPNAPTPPTSPTPTTPTTTPPIRRITFAPKTQHQRRDRDIAVAWVTAQQPGRMFESGNVTATIHKALKSLGFSIAQPYIKYSMTSLVNEGYAEALVIGRRTVMFMLKDDVEVPVPVWVTAAERKNAEQTNGSGPTPTPAPTLPTYHPPVPTAPVHRTPPPLPRQPTEPIHVLHDAIVELHDAILAWWREEPDEAEVWVHAALEALQKD